MFVHRNGLSENENDLNPELFGSVLSTEIPKEDLFLFFLELNIIII